MKLVLGYNGTNSSKKALALVQKYAKEFNAEVHILTSLSAEQVEQGVHEPISWVTRNDLTQLREHRGEESDIAKEAKSRLESVQKALAEEGIKSDAFAYSGIRTGRGYR